MEQNKTAFIMTKDALHLFYFICEGCKCEGRLGLDAKLIAHQIHCPEDCGAVYILWNNPLTNLPDLKCVVCPVSD